MYTEIGSFDAKTKLAELLRGVQHGERYTITLRGRPVADLIPSGSAFQPNAQASVTAMSSIQKVRGVSTETLLDWIAQGRK